MIEDNKSVSEMMQMFFQKEGWDVTFAYDGIEAIDLFNEDPDSWDMITLDLNLPKKMDGGCKRNSGQITNCPNHYVNRQRFRQRSSTWI